ncbi:MAG: HAMP domain-containing protein [Planctomycetes bacterium]|nr:HAMP domain-containing protein [Planctomycetota bacterium]
MSVRTRLALWHAGILALLVLGFAAATYLVLRAKLYGQIERQLTTDLELVDKAYPGGAYEIAELDEHGAIALFKVTGDPSFQSHGWGRSGLDRALTGGDRRWTWVSEDGHEYRFARQRKDRCEVVVAQDTTHARGTLKSLFLVLALGLPFALLGAVGGGYVLAGRLLGPVGSMAARAARITAESLSERLPVENPRDEFGRLATAFNEVLARLHDSFERLRRFTADASHELRTPLTALRSVGEVALQGSLDPAAYRDVIGSMLEEVDRLARLVDSLLTLTRGESGRIKSAAQRVDLGELSSTVADCLRVLAEEKDQTLSVEIEKAVFAEADPAILRQAVTNLLDNAIKYTPSKGRVLVRARNRGSQEAVIEVIDSGPGIAPQHRERVFDRFYRIDRGRDREAGGVGLGLAIARWAVEMNRGRIELETEEGGGSTFRIVVPRPA